MGEQHLDFLAPCRERSKLGVLASARAMSRASSSRSRGILRAGVFGQQRGFSSQTSQSQLAGAIEPCPVLVTPVRGVA